MTPHDTGEDRSELVYFGTPASGTRMLGLSMATVAKIASVVLGAMAVIGLASGVVRLVIGIVLLVALLASLWATMVVHVHPLAWVKMWLSSRLARRSRGVTLEGQFLMSRGTRQLVGGLYVLGETPTLLLRAQRDEASAWSELLNEVSNRLISHGEVVVRSAILPQTLVEDLRSCSAAYRRLALGSYQIATTMLVVAPPGAPRARRVAMARAITGLAALGHSDRLTLVAPEVPSQLIDDACGNLSATFSTDGTTIDERVDMLIGAEFAASMYVVTGWPGRSIDPRMLLALFGPGPPSRVVSIIIRPIETARAQRHVARHRTEMVADRRLRRERGYLDRARDDYREATAQTQEEDLLAGYRLCRYQLIVALLAPSPSQLVASRAALETLAASAQLRLKVGLGEQRALFERALLGVNGWS